ncbi:TPA: hypothetical protein ACXI73_002909 [Stenotrophomonas maltophilia]
MHSQIAAQVGCSVDQYFSGVEKLIDAGHFLRQVDGVLYSRNGTVHSYDHERVAIVEFGSYVLIGE